MAATETRKFIRYAARVDSLVAAWSFVMGHVDEFQSVNIEMTACLGADEAEDGAVMWDCAVFGDVEGGW